MATNRAPETHGAGRCNWRTSSETLDVIEALERIEALLNGLDARLRDIEARDRRPVSVSGAGTPSEGT